MKNITKTFVQAHISDMEGRSYKWVNLTETYEEAVKTIDNWTNAVSEVLALEEPLRAFLSTNAVVQPGLNWRMEVFERLRTKVETGDKTGASDDLKAFQIGLRREIESYERLHGLESAFRSVLADLERARDKLETERAKPFDPQNRTDGKALSTERSDGGRP